MDTSTAPLRTAELVAADPQAALSDRPACLHAVHLEYPEGHEEDPARFSPTVTIVLGKKHVTSKNYSPLQVAFMLEMMRFGGATIVTNHNGTGRHYERISFDGYPEDLTTLSRVFSGAAEYDQTKVGGIKSDMRAENLRHDPAEKIGKDARQVVLGHAARIAEQAEAEGRMPPHLTAIEYLVNLIHLLHLIDREAAGMELHDLVSSAIKRNRGPVEAGREA